MLVKPEYIFVVGSFRSGTTLVYRILNSSEEIGICWETHFLGHLTRPGRVKAIQRCGNLAKEANVRRAVDCMYSFKTGYWRWFRENVDKESFTQRFLETDRTERALFDLMMEVYAGDRQIKGEKTPSHLYYVPVLLDWFPNARIVHTLRDPRAIYVSELRKKKLPQFAGSRHRRLQRVGLLVPYILLHVSLTWLRVVQLHKRYQVLYPNRYLLVRFEDLLSAPEQQLESLSHFLSVKLPPQLLDDLPSNSSWLARRQELGIDVAATDRWKGQISPRAERWFLLWFGKQLAEHGYA